MKARDRLIPQAQQGDLKGREEEPEREDRSQGGERGGAHSAAGLHALGRCSSPLCLGALYPHYKLSVITLCVSLLTRPGMNAAHPPRDAGRGSSALSCPKEASWPGPGGGARQTVHPFLLPQWAGPGYGKYVGTPHPVGRRARNSLREALVILLPYGLL